MKKLSINEKPAFRGLDQSEASFRDEERTEKRICVCLGEQSINDLDAQK